MDFLIKNNIIKQNKLIVDIGMFSTKLLEINYAAKKINVTSAKIFDNSRNSDEYELDFENIARRTYEKASGNGRKNVVAVLPTELTENKIITVKNKKEKDIPRIISREHMSFGRVSRITHVVDYAYLGKRIESGDTVMYFLISAVKKSIANDLVSAFAEYKMSVKTIISNIYAQICLSELFFDEYENLNRLFVDFGTNSIRVTAFAEGVAVYTRTIDMGFESYIKTISSSSETAGKSDIVKALNQVGEITGLNDSAYGDVFRYLDKSVYVSCVKEVKIGTAYIVFIMAVPSLSYILIFKAVGNMAGLPTTFIMDANSKLMYVLPIISLTLPSVGGLMRWLRRYMIDQMNSDYVKFARSGGLSEGEIFSKHILKNAAIPIVHGIPGAILGALAGAFITERVYVVPGIGGLLINAIGAYDNGVIVGVTLFYAVLSVTSMILGDVLMSIVDPRISFTAKAR